MISTNKRRLYGEVYNDVRCLSTDEKPTDVKNGSTLVEIDTGNMYMFDAEGSVWNQLPSSGGGGGGGNEPKPSSTAPKMDGEASSGSSLLYARADHVHPTDTSRASTVVATTSANGLMSAADKAKLNGIAANANAYELPPATASALGGVKPDGTTITVDSDGTIHGASTYELPTMSASTKGGAKLGDGLAITDGALGIDPTPQESTGEVRGAIASLTAKGWATQDGTPTPESPVPIQVARWRNLWPRLSGSTGNGITWTANADGSVTANGTASADTVKVATIELAAGTYTMSAGIDTSQNTSYNGYVQALINGSYTTVARTSGSPSPTFTLSEGTTARLNLRVLSGKTVSNLTFYPQLELGSTPTPYVPYGHVGIDITHDGTTTTIPVPLPSKGYAAALPDGTADVLTIDGAGKVEWTSATGMVEYDGSSDEVWNLSGGGGLRVYENSIIASSPSGTSAVTPSICTHFVATSANDTYNGNLGFAVQGGQVNFSTGTGAMVVADWTAWLAQNPITVLYPLATPATEQCGYLDWPTIPDGAIITCPELDALGVHYLIGNGVAEMARDWYERAKSEYDGRILALEQAVAELATA